MIMKCSLSSYAGCMAAWLVPISANLAVFLCSVMMKSVSSKAWARGAPRLACPCSLLFLQHVSTKFEALATSDVPVNVVFRHAAKSCLKTQFKK